jgi:hypothetical protein
MRAAEWEASVITPAWLPVKLIAGTPRSDSAMLISDMLMRSPVVSSMSSSRRLGRGLT